jgi:hypothetical protein
MHLQRLTHDHMSCFAIGFPVLVMTEYPQASFKVAKVSSIGYDIIPLGLSCTLRPCRYSHSSPTHPTKQIY